jgi:hypothetical protein
MLDAPQSESHIHCRGPRGVTTAPPCLVSDHLFHRLTVFRKLELVGRGMAGAVVTRLRPLSAVVGVGSLEHGREQVWR